MRNWSLLLLSAGLAHAQMVSHADTANLAGEFTDHDIHHIVMAIDQNQDGSIDATESSAWIFADLFYQATLADGANTISTEAMAEKLMTANQQAEELIDASLYQEKVLATYADGFLDKTEIAYMSGENIFPQGSEFVDENLTVDALMTLDINNDEQLTMQELLQEDLSEIIADQNSSTSETPAHHESNTRTEFVTK